MSRLRIGTYPVAGNGPSAVLDRLHRSHAKLTQSQLSVTGTSDGSVSAAPPKASFHQDNWAGRPNSAPQTRIPTSPRWQTTQQGPRRESMKSGPALSFRRLRGSVSAGMSPQSTHFSGSSNPNSPDVETYHHAIMAVSQDRTSSSLRNSDGTQHAHQPAPSKGFIDVLDAHSEIKPADFRGRVQAAGARDYGEDVADRNIGENGVDLQSPQVQAFYASLNNNTSPRKQQPASTVPRSKCNDDLDVYRPVRASADAVDVGLRTKSLSAASHVPLFSDRKLSLVASGGQGGGLHPPPPVSSDLGRRSLGSLTQPTATTASGNVNGMASRTATRPPDITIPRNDETGSSAIGYQAGHRPKASWDTTNTATNTTSPDATLDSAVTTSPAFVSALHAPPHSPRTPHSPRLPRDSVVVAKNRGSVPLSPRFAPGGGGSELPPLAERPGSSSSSTAAAPPETRHGSVVVATSSSSIPTDGLSLAKGKGVLYDEGNAKEDGAGSRPGAVAASSSGNGEHRRGASASMSQPSSSSSTVAGNSASRAMNCNNASSSEATPFATDRFASSTAGLASRQSLSSYLTPSCLGVELQVAARHDEPLVDVELTPASLTGARSTELRPSSAHARSDSEDYHSFSYGYHGSSSHSAYPYGRTRSLVSSIRPGSTRLDDITEHIPIRTSSLRNWSITSASETMTISDASSNPFQSTGRPVSRHTANTSVDLSSVGGAASSGAGSIPGATEKQARPTTGSSRSSVHSNGAAITSNADVPPVPDPFDSLSTIRGAPVVDERPVSPLRKSQQPQTQQKRQSVGAASFNIDDYISSDASSLHSLERARQRERNGSRARRHSVGSSRSGSGYSDSDSDKDSFTGRHGGSRRRSASAQPLRSSVVREEELLFRDEGYGAGGLQLPGLVDSVLPPGEAAASPPSVPFSSPRRRSSIFSSSMNGSLPVSPLGGLATTNGGSATKLAAARAAAAAARLGLDSPGLFGYSTEPAHEDSRRHHRHSHHDYYSSDATDDDLYYNHYRTSTGGRSPLSPRSSPRRSGSGRRHRHAAQRSSSSLLGGTSLSPFGADSNGYGREYVSPTASTRRRDDHRAPDVDVIEEERDPIDPAEAARLRKEAKARKRARGRAEREKRERERERLGSIGRTVTTATSNSTKTSGAAAGADVKGKGKEVVRNGGGGGGSGGGSHYRHHSHSRSYGQQFHVKDRFGSLVDGGTAAARRRQSEGTLLVLNQHPTAELEVGEGNLADEEM